MPWLHRYFGNPVLTGLLNLFFRTPVGDAHCGFRGFCKDAYLQLDLRSSGMEFASEMIVKAALWNYRMSEVPVVLYKDGRDRPPHLRSFRDGWRHLRLLLLMCPLWLYLIPSLGIMVTGLVMMAWLTSGPQEINGVGLDADLMIFGSLLTVLGSQTIWLWLFARTHAWIANLLPLDIFTSRLLDLITLERGLLGGAFVVLTGIVINAWLCNTWQDYEVGTVIGSMRSALCWGYTLIILGAQTMFSSFFLCLLRMSSAQASANQQLHRACGSRSADSHTARLSLPEAHPDSTRRPEETH
jgi:hypothetical protein